MNDLIIKARVISAVDLKKSLDETEISEQKIKLILEKGRKPLADGTVREWQGKKYKKEGGKWMPLGTGRGRGRPKGATKKGTPDSSSSKDSYQRKEVEDEAKEFGKDKKKVLKRIKEAVDTYHNLEGFKDGVFDAETNRLYTKDKRTYAEWRIRPEPNEPISYNNQQTSDGYVRIVDVEREKKAARNKAEAKAEREKAEKDAAPNNVEKGFIKITTPITDKKLVKELKSKVFVLGADSATLIPESKVRSVYKMGDYYFAVHQDYSPSSNRFTTWYTITNLDTGKSAGSGKSVEEAIKDFNAKNINVDKFNEIIKQNIDKMEIAPAIEKKPYVMNDDDKQKADIKSRKEQLYKDAVQEELDDSSAYDENGVVRARKVTDKATREKVINSTYYSGNLFLNGTGYSYLIKVPSDKVTGVLEIGEGNYAVVVPIFDSVTGEFSGKKSLIESQSGAKMYNASMEYGMRANGIPFKETPSTENDFAYHATLGLKHVKGSGVTKDDIDKVIKKAVDSNKDAKKFESLDDYKKYVEELVNKEK